MGTGVERWVAGLGPEISDSHSARFWWARPQVVGRLALPQNSPPPPQISANGELDGN